MFAIACALVFLLFHLGNRDPAWTFGVALVVGLAGGALRGFTMRIEVDHMFDKVRLPRTYVSVMVASILIGAVLLEIVGAFAGDAGTPFRDVAPEIAAACSGFLTGRASAIAVRWRSVPHVDLHRA